MKPCQACQGPDREPINEALVAGCSVRDVAARFGLSKSGVSRHKTSCLQPQLAAVGLPSPTQAASANAAAPTPVAAHDMAEPVSQTALVEGIKRSLQRLDDACVAAAEKNLYSPLATLSGQYHKGVETVAKLCGLYAEPPPDNAQKFSLTINMATPEGAQSGPRNITPLQPDKIEAEPFTLELAFGSLTRSN